MRGHAQVKLPNAGRTPLGFWDDSWDAHRGEDWHATLFAAFKTSMSALQRHEETDMRAAMNRAANPQSKQPTDQSFEARLLDAEMTRLEAIDLDALATNLAARREALSPFASPIDKADANQAAIRTELRALLRGMQPTERLAALRGDMDEHTASAILSAPPVLSGLSQQEWSNFREARLRLRHPEKLAALEAAAAASRVVRRCLDAARTSTRERLLPLLPPAPEEVKPLGPAWVE